MRLFLAAKMIARTRNFRLVIMALIESAIFVMAFVGAYLLRFEFLLGQQDVVQITTILLFLVPLKLVVFFFFGLYNGIWRYFSLEDAWRLAQASIFASILSVTLLIFFNRFSGFSRAVFLLDAILTFLLTGGLRMGIRTLHASYSRMADHQLSCLHPPFASTDREHPRDPKRILIVGAGSSGERLLRDAIDNVRLSYNVVGFLDDDPGKHGRSIRRVPVFGAIALLPQVVEQHSIDQVIITMPSATGAQLRRVIEICKRGKVPYKTLPAIGKILDGHVSINALRDVSYEDLLGRPPVKLDMSGIREYLTSKRILVTGAGGSIGSELSRQLVQLNPAQLILVDACEGNLFNIGMELRHEFGCVNQCCVLAHVQNRPLMERVFATYRPEIVFHAAAYKHVPLLERNPWKRFPTIYWEVGL